MKSQTAPLVGNCPPPITSAESSFFKMPTQSPQSESFTDHLRSAESKRLRTNISAKTGDEFDLPEKFSKESSATKNFLTTGARHAKLTIAIKPARPLALAQNAVVPDESDTKKVTESKPRKSNSAVAAAPTEAQEDEESPESATLQTTPANQAALAIPLVVLIPPVIPPRVILTPTLQPTTTGEVAPVTADSPGGSPEQTNGAATPDSSQKNKVADEKIASASALKPGDPVNPDQQQATFTGDSGEHGQEKPQPNSLTSLPVASDGQTDGTAAAKQKLTMNNTVEMEKSAESAVKNLPTAERVLEVPAPRVISRVAEVSEARSNFQVEAAVSSFSASTNFTNNATTTTNTAALASDVPAVERAARAIMEGVVQMRHTGAESVSVVLKPDGGTELLLRVEMRDGAVSAELHFERGDRGALNQHFDELQRRLAEQGVRLNRADDSSMGGNAQFAQSQRQPFVREDDSMANVATTVTKKNSNNQTVTRRTARGFETWA